jgi:HK97 family phage major capsid protein
MPKTAREWLEKATFTTADLASGGRLSPQQVREFLRVAMESGVITKEMRYEDSDAPLFEVPRISLNTRVLRRGTEGQRLADEVLEDNVEKERLADTIMAMLAEAVGRDVEELFIKGDTARTASEDQYLDSLDGIIKQLQVGLPAAQKIDASGITRYDDLFHAMLSALPPRYRTNVSQLRFYVPVRHHDGYVRELRARGTRLGDDAIIQNMTADLGFAGIPVRAVPLMSGTDTINSASVDYGKFVLLVDPQNLIAGFQRRIRVERYRDPREGVTSFVVTLRCDVKIADPEFGVLAYNVNL